MAKAAKKKSAKEASSMFHNVMAASVSNNAKPSNKIDKKPMEFRKELEKEIESIVPNYKDYLTLRINDNGTNQIYYNINYRCPQPDFYKIQDAIINYAGRLNLPVITSNQFP